MGNVIFSIFLHWFLVSHVQLGFWRNKPFSNSLPYLPDFPATSQFATKFDWDKRSQMYWMHTIFTKASSWLSVPEGCPQRRTSSAFSARAVSSGRDLQSTSHQHPGSSEPCHHLPAQLEAISMGRSWWYSGWYHQRSRRDPHGLYKKAGVMLTVKDTAYLLKNYLH